MKKLLAILSLASAVTLSALAANPDTRVFEMRTYYAAPGKLDALHARFRDHTCKLFEKHGMTNIGYWTPIASEPNAPDNPEQKLVYVLAYPTREAREVSWKEFQGDPDWQAAKTVSEANGKLVAKVEQLFFAAADFSPEIKPSISTDGRVFELRTYTTRPGLLDHLHARFRDHTVALFQRHGMTNLFYWKLLAQQPDNAALLGAPENTLIYLLAHQSTAAAKASFDAFRADPEWVAAKKASEEKAGGSLTVEKDGVKSAFLKATDYSPTK